MLNVFIKERGIGMESEFQEIYAIKDTVSGKYLKEIWLSDNGEITLYSDLKSARNKIDRMKFGKYVSKGGTGFQIKDLIIVKLELRPVEIIKL